MLLHGYQNTISTYYLICRINKSFNRKEPLIETYRKDELLEVEKQNLIDKLVNARSSKDIHTTVQTELKDSPFSGVKLSGLMVGGSPVRDDVKDGCLQFKTQRQKFNHRHDVNKPYNGLINKESNNLPPVKISEFTEDEICKTKKRRNKILNEYKKLAEERERIKCLLATKELELNKSIANPKGSYYELNRKRYQLVL